MSKRTASRRKVLVLHLPHPTLQGHSWCGKLARPVVDPPKDIAHCQECTMRTLGMEPL